MTSAAAPPSRWTPGRLLRTVRGRMLILLMVASVPVVGIAGTSALVAYRADIATGPAEALSRLSLAAERQGSVIATLRDTLHGIAAAGILTDGNLTDDTLAGPPRDCAWGLGALQPIFRDRYLDIRLLDPDGRPLCGSRPEGSDSGGDADLLARTAAAAATPPAAATLAAPPPGLTLGRFRPAGPAPADLRLAGAVPVLQAGQLRQVLAADLPLSVFTRLEERRPGNAGLWLVDAGGNPVPLTATPTVALPEPEMLRTLLDRPASGAVEARSRDGQDFAYAVASLAPGLQLLVGLPTGAVHRHAEAMLVRRVTELGAFLLACLLVIVIGADIAVARPLRLLAARVREWRPGAPFSTGQDASQASGQPEEVRRLERAFNDAAIAISAQQDELRAALRQRDLLMAEIHHRVKNNLQIVASLLNLQAGRLRDPAAKAEFGTARDRVQALATLHRHLYTNRTFEAIALRPFLEELCQQLFTALGEVPGRRIAMVIEAPELEIVTDQAVSLALLVTEAVTNSIKHAFPTEAGGSITIAVRTEPALPGSESEEPDDVLLAIRDDGQGMDEDDDGGGIGMTLIRGFAQHLGGEMLRRPSPGGGTELSLRFPLRRRESDLPTGRMMGPGAG